MRSFLLLLVFYCVAYAHPAPQYKPITTITKSNIIGLWHYTYTNCNGSNCNGSIELLDNGVCLHKWHGQNYDGGWYIKDKTTLITLENPKHLVTRYVSFWELDPSNIKLKKLSGKVCWIAYENGAESPKSQSVDVKLSNDPKIGEKP